MTIRWASIVGGGAIGFLTPRTGVRFELRHFRTFEREAICAGEVSATTEFLALYRGCRHPALKSFALASPLLYLVTMTAFLLSRRAARIAAVLTLSLALTTCTVAPDQDRCAEEQILGGRGRQART